jgi:hypothetical protein
MSTLDASLGHGEMQHDVQRWLQQAFAAERAPVRPAVPVQRVVAAAGDAGRAACGRFYPAMLGFSLLTWLLA